MVTGLPSDRGSRAHKSFVLNSAGKVARRVFNLGTKIRTDTPATFEDTSFVGGDSPAVLDVNAALGRNATEFTVLNDGSGEFTVALSNDGVSFGNEHLVKDGGTFAIDRISIDSIRLTHVTNASYRVIAL